MVHCPAAGLYDSIPLSGHSINRLLCHRSDPEAIVVQSAEMETE
jgi:hypothetical protein